MEGQRQAVAGARGEEGGRRVREKPWPGVERSTGGTGIWYLVSGIWCIAQAQSFIRCSTGVVLRARPVPDQSQAVRVERRNPNKDISLFWRRVRRVGRVPSIRYALVVCLLPYYASPLRRQSRQAHDTTHGIPNCADESRDEKTRTQQEVLIGPTLFGGCFHTTTLLQYVQID